MKGKYTRRVDKEVKMLGKLHFWNLSYSRPNGFSNIILCTNKKIITDKIIERDKKIIADGSNHSIEEIVLLSVSYLGRMTKKEFMGD